ncbi:ATP-binding protein [Lacibacterium aquatile]|uniref:Nitrogen regulation protein n=1 Tax=Lacibacterium aquatile TaxID=1168082 RepID=A0ABW5DPH9_9PROT
MSPRSRLLIRFTRLASRFRFNRFLTIGLIAMAVTSAIATYASVATDSPFDISRRGLVGLLIVDVLLLLALFFLVVRRLVEVWAEQRRGLAGARLHRRLVTLFGAVAITPAILVAIFSILFLNLTIEGWFSDRVSTALRNSRTVAEAYLHEHVQAIRGDIQAMAADLNREGPRLFSEPNFFRQLVATQAAVRGLGEVLVIGPQGQIIARGGLTFSLEFEPIPIWAMEKAKSGEVAILTSDDSDRVRAVVSLEFPINGFLFVGRPVDPNVVNSVNQTRDAVEAYDAVEGQRSGLQFTFALVYGVLALLLLLAATWTGLAFATSLVRPISLMVQAAERVRAGDLGARVPELPLDDELGVLSRALNRMTTQLENQRRQVLQANAELDERRRFIETVVAGVTAGVIGLDANGSISMANPTAVELLGMPMTDYTGAPLRDLVPEMASLVDKVLDQPDRFVEGQVQLTTPGGQRTLVVRVTAEDATGDGSPSDGVVITFDDVTELLTAQRTAAWADVARRIAHEIKNPLTPIQLSAERLKRKYLKEITSDPETFVMCTDTIVRQVGDIGRMVDEFSSFARMPQPVMKDEDICQIAREVVVLQRHGRSDVTVDLMGADAPYKIVCDGRQIRQVLINLVQNAFDAIDGREGDDLAPGHVVVTIEPLETQTKISVRDNGKGLPTEGRERLTEPYVTTRAKGTGLGLAIVKKIVEDHAGRLTLEDGIEGGAVVNLLLPRHNPALLEQDGLPHNAEGTHGV